MRKYFGFPVRLLVALFSAGLPLWGVGCSTRSSPAGGAARSPNNDQGASPDGGGVAGGPPLRELVKYVLPFVGTDDSNSPFPVPGGAGGSTHPGAVVPFGMVQLGPDTPTASPSGYRFTDTAIEQFSLTHFNGAGCPNNEDLPFLPYVGPLTQSPGGGVNGSNWAQYRAAYDKSSEAASPGSYKVTLQGGLGVELTATARTGMVRLTYPSSPLSPPSRFLLHTGRSATGLRAGTVEILGPTKVRGAAVAGGFCGAGKTFTIYFVIEFDTPFTDSGTWVGARMSAAASATGVASGAYLTFDTSAQPVVQAKIGLSYVSAANAEANLAAESPGFAFDEIRAAASRRWNEVLSRIDVRGGGEADLQKFYTALYHVFVNPNVASDVNGDYMGFDRAVHRANGWTVYQNFSGWDIIRSWTHLVSAIAPEAPDIIRSMVQDGVEGGLLPFWSHQNVETRVMVGDPGTVNVANAYAMGVRGFDTDVALGLMLKSATNPAETQRLGLQEWLTGHYLDNAAITLEYAMADFAISQFAGALGQTATSDMFLERSRYWKESWNPDAAYILPRATASSSEIRAARLYEVEIFGPAAPARNLAPAGTATASGACNAVEIAGQANNGTWTGGTGDKWCDNASASKWWQVDLGVSQMVNRIVIHHAGDGGEDPRWNTQDFTISVSADGIAWNVVAAVTDNHANQSVHPITAVRARHVRVEIQNAVQVPVPGSWACLPFDPAAGCGFVEGNAAQYVWMVPHDLEGLFTLMGGHAAAITRLDQLFTELNAGIKRPYFYIGNEPEHGTPWVYNFAQAPAKTSEVVRRIVDQEFNLEPGGLPGNDDLGATSSWLVWAYLGLYPAIPGSDVLVIHGPQFASAAVRLANGKTLTINGEGAGTPGDTYVQSLSVDGTATTRSWLRFADLAQGATLQFQMSDTPSPTWGAAEGDRPPSYGP